MSELENQYEQKLKSWSLRSFLTIFFCVIAANILRDLGLLPYLIGFLLSYAVALLIEYWIPPQPPVSFPVWVLKVGIFILLILAGLWVIPMLLRRWIWIHLAYGLPTFIMLMSVYWMPPLLYPVKRKSGFWAWLAFSIGFAALYGWAAPTMER